MIEVAERLDDGLMLPHHLVHDDTDFDDAVQDAVFQMNVQKEVVGRGMDE